MNHKLSINIILMLALGVNHIALADTGNRVLEEVVVTAEKRSASIQDVPISVSAISGDTINDQSIRDATDLASIIPNMAVGYRANNAVVNLRGVETNIAFNESASAAVAFHLDGVYMTSLRGGSSLFNDVERVEVSRGPQGTLAGRNSTAGSINVVTRRPGNEFEAAVEVGTGNFDQRKVSGLINIPFIDNRLAFRLNYMHTEHDGYLINDRVNPDIKNADDDNTEAFRASVLYDPTDNLSIFVKAYYEDYAGVGPQFIPFLVPGDALANAWQSLSRGFGLPVPTNLRESSDPRVFSLDTQPENSTEVYGITSEITWDWDAVTITYIGNYHKDDNKVSRQDMDGILVIADGTGPIPPGVPAGGSFGPYSNSSEQFSHELRLTSNNDSALNWVTGLYYSEQDQETNRQIALVNDLGFLPGYAFGFDIFDVPVETTSWGAYADAKYRLNDAWEIFAGLRYSDDEQAKSLTRNDVFLGMPRLVVEPTVKDQWDSVDWRAGLTWYINEHSMIYASVSTGYKAGGVDTSDGPYEEEEVTAYEVGSKNTFIDGRLRVNASLFYNDYGGIQLGAVRTGDDGIPGSITDVMPAEVFGFEMEAAAILGDATTATLSIGYLDTEIGRFVTCDPVRSNCAGLAAFTANQINIKGNDLPKAPDWTISFGLEHVFSLGEYGTLVPKLQTRFTDDQFLTQFNDTYDAEGSFTKTNLYLTYNSPDERFFAQAYAKNLENEDTRNQILSGLVTFAHAQWDAPRTYGMRVGYRWE